MIDKLEYYDIRQAAKHSGFDTTYMVDYLCKEGLIEPVVMNGQPSGRGRKRLFTFQDLIVLRLYRKLLKAGVSVKRLKQALLESQEFSSLKITREGVKLGRKEVHTFCADGRHIYIRTENEPAIQAGTGGQFVFSFVVNLQDLHQELSDKTKSVLHYKRRENGQGFRRCQAIA